MSTIIEIPQIYGYCREFTNNTIIYTKIPIGEGYKFIEPGEKLQKGDQCWNDNNKFVDRWFSDDGVVGDSNANCLAYRRKIVKILKYPRYWCQNGRDVLKARNETDRGVFYYLSQNYNPFESYNKIPMVDYTKACNLTEISEEEAFVIVEYMADFNKLGIPYTKASFDLFLKAFKAGRNSKG